MAEEKSGKINPLFIVLGLAAVIVVALILLNANGSQPPSENGSEVTPPTDSGEPAGQTQEEIDAVRGEAMASQDSSVCQRIERQEDVIACQEDVIIARAIAQKDL